jgi:hypothetical protein
MVVAGEKDRELGFTPEAEMLLLCARAVPVEAARSRFEALLSREVNWELLLESALRHKVMPLLYRGLKSYGADSVPADFAARLKDYFYLNAARNLLLEEELGRVLDAFAEGGIPCVPYKGPALAAQLYGDAAYRQFSDLDIFVRKDDALRAGELLRLRGYRREQKLTASQEKAFLKVDCQFMFMREGEPIYLELHWGFTPTYLPVTLDSEGMWGRLESIYIGGTKARAFSAEDLLLILCVNAGKEFWRELQNLCDIAGLIRSRPGLDWERIERCAAKAGARRMLFTSLLLARDLLGTSVHEEVLRSARRERASAAIANEVGRIFFQDRNKGRDGSSGAGRVSRFLRPSHALDGALARARFYLRLALTPTLEDWTYVKLPYSLRGLYYLTRPVRLAGKYLLRRGNSKRLKDETSSSG